MIKIQEISYPIGFGAVALDSIERLIDDSVSRWDEEKLSHQYALIYSCVKQGCRREKQRFTLSYDDFLENMPTDKSYIEILKPCIELLVQQFTDNSDDEGKD